MHHHKKTAGGGAGGEFGMQAHSVAPLRPTACSCMDAWCDLTAWIHGVTVVHGCMVCGVTALHGSCWRLHEPSIASPWRPPCSLYVQLLPRAQRTLTIKITITITIKITSDRVTSLLLLLQLQSVLQSIIQSLLLLTILQLQHT